ncbi:MAG: hypothetical protein NMNS01_07250 [Nitrosomonas sp.]|jgi:hypothetical protein|nr:MAG: hypothetical protein NMNS01_07250 [Nitrosomonas sp.]
MQDDETSTNFDDDEILNKVDNLLHKHQIQANTPDGLSDVLSAGLDSTQFSDGMLQQVSQSNHNEIPTLTEVVTLHPVTMPEQSECTQSLQQILTAALQEVEIDLNTSDRIALLQALEKRLIHKLD